tara:strand:- start:2923 stop:3441 length:519 start_codon:yes stop_codon:yes gene_type:complete
MRQIDLLDDEIKKCHKFADEVLNETYNRFNQQDNERKKRIFFGKLGEIGFIKFLSSRGIKINSSKIFNIYPGEINADKFDIITKYQKTIDIKTAYEIYHKRIIIPKDQFENNKAKDFYVGVKLDYFKKKIFVIGYVSKAKLIANGKKNFGEGYGYWEFLEKLNNIEDLIKII